MFFKKAWIMNEDSIQTTILSLFATVSSFVMLHLPEIQAFITFSLTVIFLCYKIREARANALKAEKNEQRKRY